MSQIESRISLRSQDIWQYTMGRQKHLICHLLGVLDQVRIVFLELMEPGPADARDGVDAPGAESGADSCES